MEIKTIQLVIKWFKKYQPNITEREGIKLYKNLIGEETQETEEALKIKDMVEYLDGLGDQVWVRLGLYHFSNGYFDKLNEIEHYFYNDLDYTCNYIGDSEQILDELLNIIADSNNTKELAQQTEGEKKFKVIKGDNFIPPTEGIKKLIEKYNITFKD